MPPLGYDIEKRALIVNQSEAELVRFIFQRFLEMKSVHVLKADLDSKGIKSKLWTTAKGERRGGFPFSRGALYDLLGNATYRGGVEHKGKIFPGQHQRIVEDTLWDEVQTLRAKNAKQARKVRSGAKLIGKIFDDRGNAMAPTSTHKGQKRYTYYVSAALASGQSGEVGSIGRVPRDAIEKAVVDEVSALLSPSWQSDRPLEMRALAALSRAIVGEQELVLEVRSDAVQTGNPQVGDHDEAVVRVTRPISFAKPRNSTMLIRTDRANPSQMDRALIRALARAHAWTKKLETGAIRSVATLAKQEKLCPIYTRSVLPLAFLAPDLTQQILEGRQPRTLTLTALLAEPLPLDWIGQRARFESFD